MKISIRQKLLFFSFSILAGIVLIGYGVYKSNQKLLDSAQWVEHTEQVIYQSGNILSLAIDIETASRGFVITNDSTFLEPLNAAEKTTFEYIRQLRQLTQDNPLQQQRVDSLNFYMHRSLVFSLQAVEIRSKQGLAAAIAHTSTKEGKKYFDHLRQITNAIQQEEGILLKQRKQANGRSAATFNLFSMVMFILMVLVTIFLLIAAGNHLRQNKEKEKRAAELIIANKGLKKAEDDIRKLNEELEQKVIDRTAQLESVNKELESFSYSVSHDLRAPIRAINGYAKILQEDYAGKFDAEGTGALHSVMYNSKKMGDLIDDLLAFSKLGRKQVTVSEINMDSLVKSIREELLSEDSENKNGFKVTALPPAKGDASLIKQVWINLISNAIKYSKYKPKKNIEIGAYEKDEFVVYYVKDNGAGFDMQYYDKLFGVFQRLHSQDEFEGTGIGLAIVQKIVHRHSGTVWAESILNEGTCFYFSLPYINS